MNKGQVFKYKQEVQTIADELQLLDMTNVIEGKRAIALTSRLVEIKQSLKNNGPTLNLIKPVAELQSL